MNSKQKTNKQETHTMFMYMAQLVVLLRTIQFIVLLSTLLSIASLPFINIMDQRAIYFMICDIKLCLILLS